MSNPRKPSDSSSGDVQKDPDTEALLQTLSPFWQQQLKEIQELDYSNLKHQLPLARIKKIMRADEDVRMVSAEAPIVFAKACELFILDLSTRAWAHAGESDRRTLQQADIVSAIAGHEVFDFLVDILPTPAVATKKEGGSSRKRRGSVASQKSAAGSSSSSARPAKKVRSSSRGPEEEKPEE